MFDRLKNIAESLTETANESNARRLIEAEKLMVYAVDIAKTYNKAGIPAKVVTGTETTVVDAYDPLFRSISAGWFGLPGYAMTGGQRTKEEELGFYAHMYVLDTGLRFYGPNGEIFISYSDIKSIIGYNVILNDNTSFLVYYLMNINEEEKIKNIAKKKNLSNSDAKKLYDLTRTLIHDSILSHFVPDRYENYLKENWEPVKADTSNKSIEEKSLLLAEKLNPTGIEGKVKFKDETIDPISPIIQGFKNIGFDLSGYMEIIDSNQSFVDCYISISDRGILFKNNLGAHTLRYSDIASIDNEFNITLIDGHQFHIFFAITMDAAKQILKISGRMFGRGENDKKLPSCIEKIYIRNIKRHIDETNQNK